MKRGMKGMLILAADAAAMNSPTAPWASPAL